MSEKAKALGIPEEDLRTVLLMARNFRAEVINRGLDPRATRIAIVFMNLCDYHFARQRLGLEDLAKPEEIAGDLYTQVSRRP